MKKLKVFKFVLPSLALTPVIAIAGGVTSCGQKQEDLGPTATKVTITNVVDQQEFDVQNTKVINLKASVEPAEANQEVTYEILAQEGTGNIACSQTGIIYPNNCSGTITVRAWSKDKKACSDPVELVFWDSSTIKFVNYFKEDTGVDDYCYAATVAEGYENILDAVVPSYNKVIKDGVERTLPVVGTSYGGFSACSSLRYLRFPQKTQHFQIISSYSFYQCNRLKKVTIPESVLFINTGAFQSCASLESVKMNTTVISILKGAFKNCVSLSELDLPDSLTYIGPDAFAECSEIKTFNVGPNVKTIGEGAFVNCWNSTINVNKNNKFFDSDDRAVYDKNHTRLICVQYTSDIKDFVVEDSVESIDSYAFCFDDALESISFNKTSKCSNIGEFCFSLCFNLKQVNLNCAKMTRIRESVFSYCSSLAEINIPANIVQIDRDAFYGCDSLARAHFDSPSKWQVTNDSFETKLLKQDVVLTSDEGLSVNAWHLFTYGSFVTEEGQDPEWVGGYCNCVWSKYE